jgi:HPt (histidine-containing phosphotransfer) domain-containing protein
MAEVFDRRDLLTRVDEDEELLDDLLQIFLEHTSKQLHELGKALEAGDVLGLREQAHALKGAAAGISAEAMRQVAGELELSGKNHNLAEARFLLEALIQKFARLQEVLKKEGSGAGQGEKGPTQIHEPPETPDHGST